MLGIKIGIVWSRVLLPIFFSYLLAGCGGGQKSHDILTPASGTVLGVATRPGDSETRVDVDTWIHVYWPNPSYPPPSRFNFRLEKADDAGDWQGVNTSLEERDSNPRRGSWWFSPTFRLDWGGWYRIVITDNYGNVEYVVFRTGRTLRGSSTLGTGSIQSVGDGFYRPAGKETAMPSERGSLDHVIIR